MKRSDRQMEKDKIIKQLSEEYGLEQDYLKSLTTDKLRRTLHAIRREMKNINKNVKIVIIGSNNDNDSDCSYCDTDDSECEYCDSDDDTEISIDPIDPNELIPDLEESD